MKPYVRKVYCVCSRVDAEPEPEPTRRDRLPSVKE